MEEVEEVTMMRETGSHTGRDILGMYVKPEAAIFAAPAITVASSFCAEAEHNTLQGTPLLLWLSVQSVNPQSIHS